jgi:hypothetical protein
MKTQCPWCGRVATRSETEPYIWSCPNEHTWPAPDTQFKAHEVVPSTETENPKNLP